MQRDGADRDILPAVRETVVLLGASGTIGRATAQALLDAGFAVRCLLRQAPRPDQASLPKDPNITLAIGDLSDPKWLADALASPPLARVLISCLASRTGATADAWAVDYAVNSRALKAAQTAGLHHFIMLSAICVQKPQLGFQQAKLAFEAELQAAGLTWSIVRPTAFFKSLSGQVDRLRKGKPFLVFGDGRLTACKPISDRDLGAFLVGCIADVTRHNAILPIGGPGPALTPLDQGLALFQALGLKPKFRHVSPRLMDAIVGGLTLFSPVSKKAAAKCELAKIGRYYATESMLVLDPATGRYCAAKTPSYGQDTLPGYFAEVATGHATVERGEHAVF